jgi:hypothetical protein
MARSATSRDKRLLHASGNQQQIENNLESLARRRKEEA